MWRLYHPNGATVDYWTDDKAKAAMSAVQGSYYEKVDYRTGVRVD